MDLEKQNPADGVTTPELIPSVAPVPVAKKSKKRLIIPLVALALIIAGCAAWWLWQQKVQNKQNAPVTRTSTPQPQSTANNTPGLNLDPAKNYGDKYATGILPVGDNQYSTGGADKGKVYLCNANFVPANQAGAQSRGPWFVGTTQWDIKKKYAVRGGVFWKQAITNTINGDMRVISTNDLPDHPTGTFPVASSDPAYQYDRNPNSIKSQSLTYNLSSSPAYGAPQCMGGEVGVMLTGAALFNAFDAGGRDAGAWEIQDACQGHPQSSGLYHYHTMSSCIKNISVSTVIGFALDGFPITGPRVRDGHYLTTSDLDECHGITSEITLDGKKVTTYHYAMTQDFPYSVSCFRAKPIQAPGQHMGGQQSPQSPQQGQPPASTQPPRPQPPGPRP